MADAAIRETDNDAAASRLSAVETGYLSDAYAACFVKRRQPRPPLINVGTYLRTWSIDILINQFLDSASSTHKQIISIGAGTDTRFFGIATNSAATNRYDALHRYIEIDFGETTSRKVMTIRKNRALDSVLSNVRLRDGGTGLISDKYCLVAGDLRHFNEVLTEQLEALLDPSIPTLVLAECVFVYMGDMARQTVLRWAVQKFSNAGLAFVSYDPLGLHDRFGQVMLRNLEARGIRLISIDDDVDAVKARLTQVGFTAVDAILLSDIRQRCIPASEVERIASLEMLDEVEELLLILRHYAVVWAHVGPALGTHFGIQRT